MDATIVKPLIIGFALIPLAYSLTCWALEFVFEDGRGKRLLGKVCLEDFVDLTSMFAGVFFISFIGGAIFLLGGIALLAAVKELPLWVFPLIAIVAGSLLLARFSVRLNRKLCAHMKDGEAHNASS